MRLARSHTTLVLAMSADGKIADAQRSPARFGAQADQQHLETQIAQADAVLMGGATLRAYGSTLTVRQPQLLQQRHQRGQPEQPIQIICSASGQLPSDCRFFSQPVPRWLLTTPTGAERWQNQDQFEQIWPQILPNHNVQRHAESSRSNSIDWRSLLQIWRSHPIQRLAVLGGGQLAASLFEQDCLDELWLTICPLLIGGATAPTPLEGTGFLALTAPRLKLLELQQNGQEVFLHYAVQD
ncbi:MAG: RibD family protein [Cyanobacteria bacterium P01_H01_bin.121]